MCEKRSNDATGHLRNLEKLPDLRELRPTCEMQLLRLGCEHCSGKGRQGSPFSPRPLPSSQKTFETNLASPEAELLDPSDPRPGERPGD